MFNLRQLRHSSNLRFVLHRIVSGRYYLYKILSVLLFLLTNCFVGLHFLPEDDICYNSAALVVWWCLGDIFQWYDAIILDWAKYHSTECNNAIVAEGTFTRIPGRWLIKWAFVYICWISMVKYGLLTNRVCKVWLFSVPTSTIYNWNYFGKFMSNAQFHVLFKLCLVLEKSNITHIKRA